MLLQVLRDLRGRLNEFSDFCHLKIRYAMLCYAIYCQQMATIYFEELMINETWTFVIS